MYWDPWQVRMMVVDLNSTNGTWLNGKRLKPMTPTFLPSDCTISFSFRMKSEDSQVITPSSPWLVTYWLLPDVVVRDDWIEAAYNALDDHRDDIPTPELRLQMVLVEIKSQRYVSSCSLSSYLYFH